MLVINNNYITLFKAGFLHSFYTKLMKIKHLNTHALICNEFFERKRREQRVHDVYQNFTIYKSCSCSLLHSHFYAFLRRADGGLAFHVIWKVIQ